MSKLSERMSKPQPAGTPPLAQAKIDEYLRQVPGWEHRDGTICKTYSFKNYYETMAFVNMVAWIAHREDHHPDMLVGYNKCKVAWNTHSVGGISMNDFICAAKIEALCLI
ncbi:MAG: 4a-hydroxytetrahydrobiopterin dehydratase [Betaproteobacteria bacterium]|nr:4a-hydroxytetrahydrobiopterin dehydratase [Betaproteobacteria bacterium]